MRLSLAGAAPGSASLAGSGPVTAKLILQTPLVRVVDGATGNAAQRIGLGSAVVRNGRVSFVLRRSESDDGHVSTLIELQRGARFASRNAPRRLPVLTANVVDGPVASRPGTGFAAPARIVVGKGSSGFGGTGDTDAQWEPAILLHEYGHFVLHTVAPDNGPEVDHNWSTSYPEQPNLAWSEGFASAFAALARPKLRRTAVPGLRPAGGELRGDPRAPGAGQRPRRPLRAVERDARRGGRVQVVKRLGGGDSGFKRLLAGLRAHRRDGHHVWTARDLRDMVVTQFERRRATTSASSRRSAARGCTGRCRSRSASGVVRGGDALGGGGAGRQRRRPRRVQLRAVGRRRQRPEPTPLNGGGFALGQRFANGGLSFLDDDDCFLISGDGAVGGDETPHSLGSDHAEVPFPFLAGGGHFGGRYEVRARYVCAFDVRFGPPEVFNCPAVATFKVGVVDPLLLGTVPELATLADVPLALNVDTVVATYTAEGKCSVGTVDCST